MRRPHPLPATRRCGAYRGEPPCRSYIDVTPRLPRTRVADSPDGRTGWAAEQHDELRPPGTRSEWSGRRSAKRKRAAD